MTPLSAVARVVLTPSHILRSEWHHDMAHDFIRAQMEARRVGDVSFRALNTVNGGGR